MVLIKAILWRCRQREITGSHCVVTLRTKEWSGWKQGKNLASKDAKIDGLSVNGRLISIEKLKKTLPQLSKYSIYKNLKRTVGRKVTQGSSGARG